MAERHIKQGANNPPITATLQDANGALDVSAASTITVTVANQAGTAIISAQTASFVNDGTDGQVEYTPTTAETNQTPGRYYAEWTVTWADATVTIFPDDGYGHVIIEQTAV